MDELRAALRQGTREAHERLDRQFRSLDLTRFEDYAIFLQAQAAPLVALEAALGEAGVESALADWPERRRSAAIRADLAALGVAEPAPLGGVDWICDLPGVLGAAYVLEGSRLGGAMLRRQVCQASDARILRAMNFLRHGEDAKFWQSFQERLAGHAFDPAQRDATIGSAIRSFAVFEQAANRVLAPEGVCPLDPRFGSSPTPANP